MQSEPELREVRLLAHLQHPNLLHLHELILHGSDFKDLRLATRFLKPKVGFRCHRYDGMPEIAILGSRMLTFAWRGPEGPDVA